MEGVAILLNNVWHNAVIDFGVLALKSYGLNSSFLALKSVWWWGTAPVREMVKKETV